MNEERREAKLMNPVLDALVRLGGSTTVDEIIPWVEVPKDLRQTYADLPDKYVDGRNRLREDIKHVADYLKVGGYLKRDRGKWSLTAVGQQLRLRLPLSKSDIETVMRPGNSHWY